MKNYLSILIVTVMFVAISCLPHHQQSSEEYQNEVKQKIAELDKLWFEAWENEELDSVMTFLDEGFLNIFGFDMTWDKEQCRKNFQESFITSSIEDVEHKTVETFVDHDYAFETLLFKQKIITNDKQDTTIYDTRLMTVYKKQEDKSWKVFRLMGQHNPNL